MKLFKVLTLVCVFLFMSCGGDEKKSETTNESKGNTTKKETVAKEKPVVKVAPKTIASGSSFIVESKNTYDKQYQTGHYTKENYTVIDYTTNAAFKATDFKSEYSAPNKSQQLLMVRIGLESLECKGRYSTMKTSFSIHIDGAEKGTQKFSAFTDEFYKANPKVVQYTSNDVSKKGEKHEKIFYFKIPKDANLSDAYLSLYRGSDEERLTVQLNP
ncbi:hypothetical protein [Kordia sp.]|uniref:hypothetical protein n=1 Tax=Kordia sp. TaxID=1965332 RepID=UPI003D6BAF38